MPFNPFTEYPTLKLPVGEKTYVVESPDADTGLWVHAMMGTALATDAGLVLDDDEEVNLFRRVLGPTYDEMRADKVRWPVLKRAGSTAVMWIAFGEDAAEAVWNGSAEGKAPNPEPSSSESEAPPASPASSSSQ